MNSSLGILVGLVVWFVANRGVSPQNNLRVGEIGFVKEGWTSVLFRFLACFVVAAQLRVIIRRPGLSSFIHIAE